RRIVTAAARAALFRPNGPGVCYPADPARLTERPDSRGAIDMSRDDQLRRRADAEALLRHPSWTSDEIDHAVAVHDLLESPDLPPDPVLVSLRSRLAVDLRRRSERSSSVMDLIRAEIFSLG